MMFVCESFTYLFLFLSKEFDKKDETGICLRFISILLRIINKNKYARFDCLSFMIRLIAS
jgi:hypothetical protein